MFCGNCGAQIVAGSKFCLKCNTPVIQTSVLHQSSLAKEVTKFPSINKRTNGFAISALVVGIAGIFFILPSILAIIFGCIAINQIKNDHRLKGKCLAVAGLVLGILVIIFWSSLIYFIFFTRAGGSWFGS
jgi:uncharacterized membrane protein YvbJ